MLEILALGKEAADLCLGLETMTCHLPTTSAVITCSQLKILCLKAAADACAATAAAAAAADMSYAEAPDHGMKQYMLRPPHSAQTVPYAGYDSIQVCQQPGSSQVMSLLGKLQHHCTGRPAPMWTSRSRPSSWM